MRCAFHKILGGDGKPIPQFSLQSLRVARVLIFGALFVTCFYLGLNVGFWYWMHWKMLSSHNFQYGKLSSMSSMNYLTLTARMTPPLRSKSKVGLQPFQNIFSPPNILLGIMTNQLNIRDRAVPILETWGKSCQMSSPKGLQQYHNTQNIALKFFAESSYDPSQQFCLHDSTILANQPHNYLPLLTPSEVFNRLTMRILSLGSLIPGSPKQSLIHPTHIGSSNCTHHAKRECFIPLAKITQIVEYPPMRKAFYMFEHMYQTYINTTNPKYEPNAFQWFIRVDDDAYVNVPKLTRLLGRLDGRNLYYLGQTGMGRQTDNLTRSFYRNSRVRKEPKNFCMGGTGIIMSRSVLALMGPHIAKCLMETVTPHDDVEIGRCIYHYAKNVECIWTYETLSIFFNKYKPTMNPDLNKAIIIHPFKEPTKVYEMHKSILIHQLNFIRAAWVRLSSIVKSYRGQKSGQNELVHPVRKPNIPIFSSISKLGQVLHSPSVHNPHIFIPYFLKAFYQDKIQVSKTADPAYAKKMYQTFGGSERSLIQLQWQPIETKPFDIFIHHFHGKAIKSFVTGQSQNSYYTTKLTYNFDSSYFREMPEHEFRSKTKSEGYKKKIINIIVPFSKRYDTLKRFLNFYEQICLKKDSDPNHKNNIETTLSIIGFVSNKKFETLPNNTKHKTLLKKIERLNKHYSRPKREFKTKNQTNNNMMLEINEIVKFYLIRGQFSRALALEYGASLLSGDRLLLFLDVDMWFNREFLRRLHFLVHRNRSVYFPIVFSQYKTDEYRTIPLYNLNSTLKSPYPLPVINGSSWRYQHNALKFTNYFSDGFWNIYGYGMVAMYKSDFIKTGGFNMDIRGWGKEDVDLFTKIITHTNLTIYRAPEPGLIHLYHKRGCSTNLPNAQYKMCLDSMSSYEANHRSLAASVLNILSKEPTTIVHKMYVSKDKNSNSTS